MDKETSDSEKRRKINDLRRLSFSSTGFTTCKSFDRSHKRHLLAGQEKEQAVKPESQANQRLGSTVIFQDEADRTHPWQAERHGEVVSGVGAAPLLSGPLTAFFASRQCPGTAIRAATAWALQQAKASQPVISGFHSPLEQSVLRILIEARSPAVVVLARPAMHATLRSAWRAAIEAGYMALVSQAVAAHRLTTDKAEARNELVARLANEIIVAHASPAGRLSQQVARWAASGLSVTRIDGDG